MSTICNFEGIKIKGSFHQVRLGLVYKHQSVQNSIWWRFTEVNLGNFLTPHHSQTQQRYLPQQPANSTNHMDNPTQHTDTSEFVGKMFSNR